MTLKVAIVGCGKIADGHVEEIHKLPALGRVVACCDREALLAEQLAGRYRIPRHYADFAALLERERPDVVHVCTPPGSHVALARAAIDAGCHVYVEKPFALTPGDARDLLAHATARGRKVTVGYASYFDPPALAMRQLIAEGVLGEPVHVESFYGYTLSSAFGQALLADPAHWVHDLPGKLFHNIIDHVINKIVEHIPDETPTVRALALARRHERFGDRRDRLMDELRVIIAGERTTAYATFSSNARPAGQFVKVYGTKNTLLVDYVARTVTVEQSATLPSAIGRLVPAFAQARELLREGARNAVRFARADFHFWAGLQTLITRFYRAILDDTPPPYPYRDIVRVAQVMDTIFKQVEAQ
jgi:predicted dehydrogenase